jgi:hypothetical protein
LTKQSTETNSILIIDIFISLQILTVLTVYTVFVFMLKHNYYGFVKCKLQGFNLLLSTELEFVDVHVLGLGEGALGAGNAPMQRPAPPTSMSSTHNHVIISISL